MENKVLFLTGARGEIGKAILEAFPNFTCIAPNSGEMDCSSLASIEEYISRLSITRIDVLIYCAGVNDPKPYQQTSDEQLLKTMNTNTFGFVYLMQALSTYFINEKTRIVAISSIYGTISRPGRIAYSASKHALNGVVKTLALELAPRGVLVNAISPGFIKTSLTYKNNSAETIADITAKIPLGRLGHPEDISKLVLMLSSEDNTYMTGQNIILDGGYLIGGFQK